MSAGIARNLCEQTHGTLHKQSVPDGLNTEAEISEFPNNAVRPESCIKLGSLLTEIGREVDGVTLRLDATRCQPLLTPRV